MGLTKYSARATSYSLWQNGSHISYEAPECPLSCHIYFLVQDISLIINSTHLGFNRHVQNIHLKGTMSQNFDIGSTFIFIQKNGKILTFFLLLFFYIS